MKKILISCLFLFYGVVGYGQQRPHYSQYLQNQFLLNPALAGTSEYYDIRLGHRSQWLGIKDAPQTYFLSGHMFLGKHIGPYAGHSAYENNWFQGIGFLAVQDMTGPLSNTTIYLNYAYNMALTNTIRLSAGVAAGIQQYSLNGEKLQLNDPSAPVAAGFSEMAPDAALGIWLYSRKMYLGASMQQVFAENMFKKETRIVRQKHFFFTSGYLLEVSDKISLVPSLLVKMVNPAPVSMDLNLKIRYENSVWAGISYRDQDALAFLLGFTFSEVLDFSYSYDAGTSELHYFNSGSHEISLGYMIFPQGKVRSPSDFW